MGVGDISTPVYIDDQGVARPCTDLKMGFGFDNSSGTHIQKTGKQFIDETTTTYTYTFETSCFVTLYMWFDDNDNVQDVAVSLKPSGGSYKQIFQLHEMGITGDTGHGGMSFFANAGDTLKIYAPDVDHVEEGLNKLDMYITPIIAGGNGTVISGGGSGGVINGDRIELSTPGQNGGTLSDNNKRWELSTALNTSTSKTIYTVENDSVVYVHVYEGNNDAVDAGMLLYAGDAVIAYVDNAKDNGGFGMTHCFPLKKGTVLSAQLDGATVDNITYRFRIQEFKFYAMAPQIAMPDYDKMTTLFNNRVSPSVNLFDGTTHKYTIPENGYVRVYNAAGTGIANPILTLMVNDIILFANSQAVDSEDVDSNFMAPVSKGDVLNLYLTSGAVEIYFFPAKAVQATTDTSSSADLYTVGSDGVLRNHAVNQVTLTGNTTLKLPAAVTGKVRDFVVDVDVSTAGTITWQNSDGTSFTTYKYDKARGSDPLSDTLTAGSTYQFYFTERRTGGSFRVELTELESST